MSVSFVQGTHDKMEGLMREEAINALFDGDDGFGGVRVMIERVVFARQRRATEPPGPELPDQGSSSVSGSKSGKACTHT